MCLAARVGAAHCGLQTALVNRTELRPWDHSPLQRRQEGRPCPRGLPRVLRSFPLTKAKSQGLSGALGSLPGLQEAGACGQEAVWMRSQEGVQGSVLAHSGGSSPSPRAGHQLPPPRRSPRWPVRGPLNPAVIGSPWASPRLSSPHLAHIEVPIEKSLRGRASPFPSRSPRLHHGSRSAANLPPRIPDRSSLKHELSNYCQFRLIF